jgi:cobalt-zinc-cadmium efflux system membrane fusion protein
VVAVRGVWRVVVVALTVSLLSTGCGGDSEATREAEAMKAAAPNRIQPDGSIKLADADRTALGLLVQPAAESDLPNATLRFGHVLIPPANEAQVVAPVTGRIARPPRVQLGAAIVQGAPLLEIIPTLDVGERISVGTQAAQRQGDIEAAQRELTKAEADLARARALSPQIVSAAQLEQAETAAATARAKLEGLQGARAAEAAARNEPVPVPAPIAGTVADVTVTVGSAVNRGDVLMRIVSSGPLWIDVAVPPDDPIGDRYEVTTPSRRLAARLLTRGRLTDASGTRQDRLVVDAPAASSLTPGSAVTVQVGHGATRGVVLPESAIAPGVESDTVFVEVAPGSFAPRPVQIAARSGSQVRLASGVKPGERVVVRGAMALQGELVRSQLRPAG